MYGGGMLKVGLLYLRKKYVKSKVVPVSEHHAMKAYRDMEAPKVNSFQFPIRFAAR
jgi:hypothetical protein